MNIGEILRHQSFNIGLLIYLVCKVVDQISNYELIKLHASESDTIKLLLIILYMCTPHFLDPIH